ncbi:gliding motility-associated C-terminal domain-containing protein [Algoriphagus sp. Y33]|uniref:Ig-like domain-containing protein n=1 Tax=Algoriphagus sp. Y33 TaxID=2772483 RepID=UPI0017861050|nr:gliding motility-associated C-terminal domain-containing protein [Algoriphagus sp. Y33]
MKSLLTSKSRFFKRLFLLLLVAGIGMESYGQTKILANEITFTSGNKTTLCGGILGPCQPTVVNPNNALTDDENFARLLASPGTAATIGDYDGVIELKFPSALPADTWSYVRLDGDAGLLDALLGGSLGELLINVLGTVVGGHQVIGIEAKNGATSVLSRTSSQGFDTDRVRLKVDGSGNYYLAIRPNAEYDRLRITNTSIFSLLGAGVEFNLDVYNAFYLDGDDPCGEYRFASFDGEGISLDLAGSGVSDAENAIDADLDSYSEISIGTLGIGTSMYQSIYFKSPSAPQDYFKVKLSVANGGALTADLIGGIEVRAYNGADLVYINKLDGGLITGLDLLGLLQSGQAVTIPFGPGVSFDRITVGYNSLISLSALSNSPIRLYDVQRYGENCPDPDPLPTPDPTDPMLSNRDCDATLIDFENANFPFNTVDGNNDTFTTLSASSGTALGIGDYDGFVELGFDARSAGTTSYVRIDFDEEVLLGLIDGTVGELLGGVVNNVLFGSHYFTVEVKNNGAQVFESSSNNGFFNQPVKIVQDKNNHYYVAITPESPYTSIRITESLNGLLGLGEVRSMNVYHVCSSTGFEECEQAFLTYSESEGISLDILELGEAGVKDAGFAIDGNPATASQISIGAAGLGSSIYQFVDFHSLSAPADHFRVKLAMEADNTLTAEVLGSIVIKAFNGDTEVFSQELRDGLISGLDLLGLLQSGGTLNLPFGTGLAFDRVAVGIESLVSVNVFDDNPVSVFSIERFSAACPDPELDTPAETDPPFNVSDCAGEVVSWENTNFPLNVIDGHNDTYATLYASTGLIAGTGYNSHIELKYADPVAAGETSYVRIEFEDDQLNALLGGSLGSDLADLLGTVALGDHYFTVTPKTAGGTDLYEASSQNGFAGQDVRVVQDAAGRFYIAFTADQPYQSVRIDHYLSALLGLGNTATMQVYSMCRETDFDLCEQATFTDFDGSGIALDLVDITQGGVFNPQNAIDENSSNYSTINLGVAGVGASVYQNIYFKTKSLTSDALRIRVQLDQPGILNLDLVGSYRVILYNGNQEVYNETLQNALINNIDLLGLLNLGEILELTIEPGVVYDRVSFGLQSLVSINTSAPIRLYGISRISEDCPDPDFAEPPYLAPVCAEELISVQNVDNLQNLFDGNFNSFATINSSGGALGTGIGAFSGHVNLGYGDGVIVPAGTTSYMRIDAEDGLLNALLGGSIGGVLSDLLNTVVLGNHYFDVKAIDAGGNELFTASSSNSFNGLNDQVKIVQDAQGRYYLAITPNADYNSIRVEDHTAGGLFGQNNSINIYGLCYDTGAEACATGFTTSFDGSGLTVGLGSIGNYGVTNPERVLDDNNNDDYSEISLGALSVVGSIQQNVQFRQTIPADGSFKIKLGIGSGVLDVGVFGRIDVVGYLDGEEVYDETLENAVAGNINLFDLFNNGADNEIRVSFGVAVDEVAIRYRSLAGVSVNPSIRLFYILQDCETPTFQSWKSYVIDGDPVLTSVSGGETVQYTIHVRNTGTVPMTDYLITDAIPAHTAYVDGSGGVFDAGVVTFDNLDIAPGATETVSFSVLVDGNLTDVEFISNVALVKSLPEDPGTETYPPLDNENPTDPDESGDTGTDIPVDPIFSAEIWKSVTVDGDASLTTVSGGETLVYTIFVRNTGNQDLTDLTISDELPLGVSYVSGGTLAGNTVTFSVAAVAAGETLSAGTFTATVDSDLTGIDEIRNIAILTSSDLPTGIESYPPVDNTNPTEPDTSAEPGTVVDVTPVHAIDFAKIGLSNNAESDGKAIVGDIITYTLTVTNTGNKALTDISVVDQIPANTTVVDNGGGTAGVGTLTFDISSLAVGAEEEFTFTVEVDAVTGSDPIINNAEAFYTDEAGDSASETAQHTMLTDCTVLDAGNIELDADQDAICEGESAVLTASLTGVSIADPIFRWYTNEDLTGSFEEGSEITVSPTATTIYYVTVSAEGYCFSTPAATTSITVNELPAVPSTSSDVTISEGFGTVLTATVDPQPADVEIVWYNEGMVEVGTGDSYNTGVLSAGVYTYYAGTRNMDTGCLSIGTTAVTVTVVPLTDDSDCTVANAQTVESGLLCVACSATSPELAVDGNPNTFGRLTVPLGIVSSISQTLYFPTMGAAGDSVKVDLGIPGGLADVGLLSRIEITLFNGASQVAQFNLNENLVNLTVLGGGSVQQAGVPATGSFDRVRVRLTGLLTLVTSLDIYEASINFAAPTAITEDEVVCQGTAATLETTPAAGTSLRWYDAPTGGILLMEGNSYTTPALNVPGTVTYYIAVLRDGCEDPVRIPVDVTVNPGATAADIQADGGTICAGDTFELSATSGTVSNPEFRFFEDEDLTVEIFDLTVNPGSTTIYYVTVSGDNVCENAAGQAAEVLVTVIPRATAADIATTDVSICEGESTILVATSAGIANPVFRFYSDAALDNEITDLTVSPTVTTTYYVTVTSDGVCVNAAGDEATITVTVDQNADDADININNTVTQCEGEDVVLAPTTTITNPIFTWYLDAAKASPIAEGTVSGVTYTLGTDGSLTISGLAASSTTEYFVTVSGDGFCENETGKSVSVSITNSLDAPEFVADEIGVCGTGSDVTFEISNAAGGLTYTVYDAATGGNIVTDGIQITGNQIVLASVDADVEYFVGVMGGTGCESASRMRIAVTVLPPATAADITTVDVEICVGESTVLTASSSTITNPVFRFYADADLDTEITDLEVSPTATTTYYVTVSGDDVCANEPGNAAELTVTVSPLPSAPAVGSSSVTITEGFATQLTASAPAGSTVVWYSESGAELVTGPTYTTPVLAQGTYIYFAASRDDVTGCESADRTMITVVVIPAGPVEDCTVSNGQTVSIDGPCVLCAVTSPQLAVDGNPSTYSRLTVPLGIVSSISQTLSFPTMGAAGDSVKVDLGIPGGLADVGLLSRIEITLFNGASQVDQFNLNESLVNLTVLGGGTRQQAGVLATGSFDRVRVRLTGLLTALTSLDIYQANIRFAAPTTITEDAVVCQGDMADLEATPSAGTSLRWYDAPTGGTLLASGNSYTTPALNVPGIVTYYIAVLRDGCEDPVRIPVDVTVNPGATAADIQADGGTICEGDSFTLTASSSTVTNPEFRFYADEALTTLITDLTVSPGSTTVYYVTVEGDNVCENAAGEAAEVLVTVTPRATASDIDAVGGTICEGESFMLTATSSTVTNPMFKFYSDAALSNEITDLNVSPAVTTTYYVSVTGGGVCENASGDGAELVVTVAPSATASDIDAVGGTICEGDSFMLTATSSTVTNPMFKFYSDAALNNEITDLNVSPAVTTTYYVTVTGDGVCENASGDGAELVVTVAPSATASDIDAVGGTICEGESFMLTATSSTVTNPMFKFYSDAALNNEITDLNVSPAVTTTYYVSVTGDGVCENAPNTGAELTVTVAPSATASDIDAVGGTICEGESFMLTATSSTVTNPMFKFYSDAALSNEITDLNVSPAVTTTYYVTVTGDNVCENASGDGAELVVTVAPSATASDIDAVGGTICEGDSFMLTATSSTVTNPMFKFYSDAALSNELTDLNVSPAVTTTYYVTVTGDGVCENASGDGAELVVTVAPSATASDIDAVGGTICKGESFMLTATSSTVTNPMFKFYSDAALSNELTDLNVSPAVTTTYYVTVTGDGVCENASGDGAELVVTVAPSAMASDIDAVSGTICEGESFMLTATAAGITNPEFKFYSDAALNNEITDLNVSPAVTTTYYVSVTGDGVCENVSGDGAELVVTVAPSATASDIDAVGGTICEGDSFMLTATSSTVTNPMFKFYSDAALSNELTDLEVSPMVTTTYYVSVTGEGVCENAANDGAELVVTVAPNATASDIDAVGGTICEGDSFMLTATSSTVTNPMFKFYSDAALSNEITDLNVSPAVTTTYYVTVTGEGVCENVSGDGAELVVTVSPAATASDIDAVGGTICEGESFMLTATAAGVTNPMFRFYSDAALSNEITDLNVSPAVTTTYYVTVTGDNVCENASDDAAQLVVTVGREALSSDIQVMNVVICEGESTLLTATSNSVTNPVFRFYTDEALTEEVIDLNVSPTVTTRYYVTVTGDEVCETKPEEAAHLTVTVRSVSAPVVTNPTQTFCEDTENPIVGSLDVTGSNIRWYESEVGGLPLNPATPLVDGATYYASQTDQMTSCESVERVSVTVALTLCDLGDGLQISKAAASPTVFPGGEITYTISVVNTASVPMDDIVVSDVLASQLTFVSASDGGLFDNGTVTWSIPSIPANTSMDLVLTVSVPADITAGTMISNVAVVTSPDDPDTPKESDPEVVEVVDPLSFTIEKVSNVSEAKIGDVITYTIKVSNVSSLVKEDILVTDTLPVGLMYVESDQGGLLANGVVSWIIPSLAPGQNIELTLLAQVTDDVEVGDIIYNTAVVDLPDDGEDPTESDPGDGVEVIDSPTDINITKTQDVSSVVPGDMITYTILLENLGDNIATGIVVTDTLPQGTMLVETNPEATVSDGVITWTIESLGVDESISLELTVMVMAEEGSITNMVTVEGDNFPDDSDQTDPVTIEDPVNEVDLVLDKEVSSSLVQVNSIFEYKITLTNNSENTSNEVVVTDILSSAVEYIGADVSSGSVSYSLETRTLIWNIATIDPMAVETMTIRVRAVSEGTVSNTASAVSDDEELQPSDNTDTASHEQLVFEIPNVFTPNGDGINDTWVIRGLQEFFPQNELVVVNRWGVEVYRSTNYQNDWNGENLNGGTYFYQFQLIDNQGVSHTMTGYVTIIK